MQRSASSFLAVSGALIAGLTLSLACGSTAPPGPEVAKTKPSSTETNATSMASAPPAVSTAASATQAPEKPKPADTSKESSACAGFRRYNEDKFAELMGGAKDPASDCTPEYAAAGCVTMGAITWGYQLASIEAKATTTRNHTAGTNEKVVCTTTSEYKLMRQGGSGTVEIAKGGETLHRAGALSESIELAALGDYDHDGEAEYLRAVTRTDAEGHETFDRSVMTFKKGAVAVYAPAKDLKIESAEDIDHDGVADLVTRGPYAAVQSGTGASRILIGPPIFAWHALADGKFSMNDKEAQAFTRSKCPSKQEHPLEAGKITNDPETPRAVVCARLWGVTEAQIAADWKTACGTKTDEERASQGCLDYPKALAHVTPPFQL